MGEELYQRPAVQTPSVAKLREIAGKYGMGDMREEDLQQYKGEYSGRPSWT